MIIVDDATNNDEAFILQVLSSEYNRRLHIAPIFSNVHKLGRKYSTLSLICNLMIVPCNPFVCMVIVDDANNHFDALTLRIVSIDEYHRILQITPIFSNVHQLG
jgi:hypothetical protein